MAKTVLTTSPGFAKLGDLADRMQAAGLTLVREVDQGLALDRALAGADYLVAGLPPVSDAVLAAAPDLRAVLKHGVGVDSIDIAAATARGIPVTSTPAANAQAVAEMALGAIFALARNVVQGHLTVTSGDWTRRRGREIAGSTLGIVGFGQIGQRLARMAQGVGMIVIAHDPFTPTQVASDMGVTLTGLAEVLAQADHVSLHLAGGADTHHLINAKAIAAMKPEAVLLNFARGTIVETGALAAALTDGHLSGAAIDAYEVEPPDLSDPIFTCPNVLFSPHSGADTAEALLRMGEMVFEDIQSLERGELPERTLNRGALGA